MAAIKLRESINNSLLRLSEYFSNRTRIIFDISAKQSYAATRVASNFPIRFLIYEKNDK